MELIQSDKPLVQPKAEPLAQPKPVKIAISSPKSLYCADYFNDHTNTGSFDRIFEGLKIVAGVKPDGNQRQTVLDEVVHLRLCAIHGTAQTQLSIPVLVNNENQTLHLQEINGWAVICFSNGNGQPIKDVRRLHMSFADLREKLAAQIGHALINPVNKLSEPSGCMDWFEITIGNSKDESRPTTDTGMIIKRDGRCAIAVVDGGANKLNEQQSAQLPVFGKAIATAALHTVECGILTLGLKDDELHAFFVVTVRLLLQAQNSDMKEWPKLNGVVFYQEAGLFGVYKKLEYGSDVMGKHYVNVNVADTVPYKGFNNENRYVYLTAIRNVEDRDDALHVSIDVFELIAGKDDFVVLPLSTDSSRYKYVDRYADSRYKTAIEKLNLNSAVTNEEEKQRAKQIQGIEKQRIRKNKTAVIFIRDVIEFAEEYDGPYFKPDTQPLERLRQQKEQLIYKQTELLNELKKSSGSAKKIAEKYNEVQILQNKVSAQLVIVHKIFVQQEKVQEKLENELEQLKIQLEQNKELQTVVLSQQKKVDSVLKQKKVLDQALGEQKEFDEILTGQNYHLMTFKERLGKNGSEAKNTNEVKESS